MDNTGYVIQIKELNRGRWMDFSPPMRGLDEKYALRKMEKLSSQTSGCYRWRLVYYDMKVIVEPPPSYYVVQQTMDGTTWADMPRGRVPSAYSALDIIKNEIDPHNKAMIEAGTPIRYRLINRREYWLRYSEEDVRHEDEVMYPQEDMNG